MKFACAILTAVTAGTAQFDFDQRPADGYGSLFSALGSDALDYEPDHIATDGGSHSHTAGQSVAHIDLAMACIDETEDLKTDITTLSSKCGTTKTDATTLQTEITSLGTVLATIKSTISTHTDALSTLQAKNAGQDIQLVSIDTDVDALEAAILALETESTTLLTYVKKVSPLATAMGTEIDAVLVVQDDGVTTDTDQRGLLDKQNTDMTTLQGDLNTADADADILIARIATFDADIATQTAVLAGQTTSLTNLGTSYTALGDTFVSMRITNDYFTNNASKAEFPDQSGTLDASSFCIEANTMIEFNFAATTSPGDTNWNVESFSLQNSDSNNVLARSMYNVWNERGRTFTFQYKGLVSTDTNFEIIYTTHSEDPGDTPDSTSPSADTRNIQWGIRQYGATYSLDTASPDTCQ